MIFISVHDNPNSVPNENDITFCLANFEPGNIDSLIKISFYLEEELHEIIFNLENKIKNFPYSCSDMFLRCENIATLFQNFSKTTRFVVEKKLGDKTKREFVVNEYSPINKIMLLGGYWKDV